MSNSSKYIISLTALLVLVGGVIFVLQAGLLEGNKENTGDKTANWQICNNSNSGFSIAYPKNFFIDSATCDYDVIDYGFVKDIVVSSPMDDFRKNWLLIIETEKTPLNVNQWIESNCVGSSGCSKSIPGAIANSQQYDLSNVHYAETDTVVKINDTIFNFSLNARNPSTPADQNIRDVYNQIISTFKFIEVDFSNANKDELLHTLFPNVSFHDGVANDLVFASDNAFDSHYNLYLKDSIAGYFINEKSKGLLLFAELDGVPHSGGLYHVYLGLFDEDGNLLTPSSVFPKTNVENPYGADYYDFFRENAHFGGDKGEFSLHDCNGLQHILFLASGCPNGTYCSDSATLYQINAGSFEPLQTINANVLETQPSRDNSFKMVVSGDSIFVKKIPSVSIIEYQEVDYKELNWNKESCRFE